MTELQRPHAQTLSGALRKLQQNEQVNPVVQHPAALPLTTPVRLTHGVFGVISGHEGGRYRITWFARHCWKVRHVWLDRGQFEVVAP